MSSGSNTQVPDYVTLANQQGQQNQALIGGQTQANRPNQYNPLGSSTWSQDANGNWTNNVSLTGQGQNNLNQYQSLLGGLLGGIGQNQGMDLSQYVTNANAVDANGIGTSLLQRLQPSLDTSRNQLSTSLAAQGLTQGSEAWNNAMDSANRQQTDAQLAAIGQGSQYAGQQIGNIQQQYALASALKNQPLTQYQALAGASPVTAPTFQNFTNAGVASAPDTTSAAYLQYKNAIDAANAATAKNTSIGQGAGSILGGMLGSSSVGGQLGGLLGGLF